MSAVETKLANRHDDAQPPIRTLVVALATHVRYPGEATRVHDRHAASPPLRPVFWYSTFFTGDKL
jgi:hypothetical protein